ncbi:hypothetical protein VCRA2120E57_1270002 [Vibrio crassostreae]|nr:hypothetical protein VCRA2120E57_1270002 [Vibrio crassostreae]
MKSKPFSLRLSDAVSDLITSKSKANGKSASEIVRQAVEFMYKDKIGIREAYFELMSKPIVAMSDIKSIIYPPELPSIIKRKKVFSREELMFIAHSLHNTYASVGISNSLLNHKYMDVILIMTLELMEEVNKNPSANNDIIPYCLNTLGLPNAPGWEDSFTDLRSKFRQSPNSGYADFLTRPITVLLESQHLPISINLNNIFTHDRVKILLPVLTYGLRHSVNGGKYFQNDQDLTYSSLPLPTCLFRKNDGLSITLHSKNLHLLITTPHNHNVWGIDEVFDLIAFAQRAESNLDSSYKGKSLNFLGTQYSDQVDIYEDNSSYRFFCSHKELKQLCDELLTLTQSPQWKPVFSYYQSEQGDI